MICTSTAASEPSSAGSSTCSASVRFASPLLLAAPPADGSTSDSRVYVALAVRSSKLIRRAAKSVERAGSLTSPAARREKLRRLQMGCAAGGRLAPAPLATPGSSVALPPSGTFATDGSGESSGGSTGAMGSGPAAVEGAARTNWHTSLSSSTRHGLRCEPRVLSSRSGVPGGGSSSANSCLTPPCATKAAAHLGPSGLAPAYASADEPNMRLSTVCSA